MPHQSLKIAFVLANIHSGSSLSLLPALINEVKLTKDSIYFFPGGRLEAPRLDEALQNKIYELISNSVDGVVSWASSIGTFVNREIVNNFHKQFSSLPLVTMSYEIDGVPLVSIDAYQAMFPLLNHFYKVHGVSQFAFLQGPAGHESGQDRLRAFRDFHDKNNLELREELISSPYDWTMGEQALQELLDTRQLLPGMDFKALIASSDLQLYQAVQTLQKRGFSIPKDLLVGGFNNSLESQIAFPPFTTVHFPIKEQAILAFRELLKYTKDLDRNAKRTLQGALVVRRSCGCIPIVDNYQNGLKHLEMVPDQTNDLDKLFMIEADFIKRMIKVESEEQNAWINPLLGALKESIRTGSHEFIEMFETILERQIKREIDISIWHSIITHLSLVSENSLPSDIQKIIRRQLDMARVLLSDALLRSHQLYQWKMDKQWTIIRHLERDLINIQHRNELSSILQTHLPQLGITKAYVMESCRDGTANCIAGFDNLGPLTLNTPLQCESGKILPSFLLTPDPSSVWIVEPLIASRKFLGWACIRVGEPVGTIYEEIRGALSKSVMSLHAIEKIQEAQADAVKAEKLKSAFLANVSSEFLHPLDAMINQLSNLSKIKDEEILNHTVQNMRVEIINQKNLLATILDLSRAEVGDFKIKNEFINTEYLLRQLDTNTYGGNHIIKTSQFLYPLIFGDKDKLLQAFRLLSNMGNGTKIELFFEEQGISFVLSQTVRQQILHSLEFETSRRLVQKIIAGHGGILEWDLGHTDQKWKIRLPYPGIEEPIQCIRSKKIFILGQRSDFESLKHYLKIQEYECNFIRSETLLVCDNPESLPDLLIIFMDSIDSADTMLLYSVFKNTLLKDVPLLLFPRSEEKLYHWNSIFSFISESNPQKQNEQVIVFYKLDRDFLAILKKQLVQDHVLDLHTIENKDACQDLITEKRSIHLLITNASLFIYEDLEALSKNTGQDIPMLIMSDALLTEELVQPLINKDRCIIVNKGVYTVQELQQLIQNILSGSHYLPAFTGNIVKKTVLYLNQHLKDSILRWKLADYVHISEDYLSRIFKKELKLSPWDYLIRLRIHTSKKLLRDTSDPIADIAEKVGFTDQAYFCRVFKKLTGFSPLLYRKGPG